MLFVKKMTSLIKEWIAKRSLKGDVMQTLESLSIPFEMQKDSIQFQVVWLKNIIRLCNMLPSKIQLSDYYLIDIGCGSGISTLFFADNYNFLKHQGINFSKKLIETAE